MKAGERNGNAKLTAAEVDEIRALRAPFQGERLPSSHPSSIASLAGRFRVSRCHISKICRGQRWVAQQLLVRAS